MSAPRTPWLWTPVVIYMAIIFAASSISHPPELPSMVSDKDAHGVLFAGLGMVVTRALAGGFAQPVTLPTWAAATAISAAYGATDEVHQYFVPPRQSDVFDLLADTGGAAIGAAACALWGRWAGRRQVG